MIDLTLNQLNQFGWWKTLWDNYCY